MITKAQLKLEIAKLETINDQIQSEIDTLHQLLMNVGFERGIESIKEAANEYLQLDHLDEFPEN